MAQKTLLSIIQQVAAELNLPQPSLVIASQDQNVQKLFALTKAVCDDLLVEHDWQALVLQGDLTTFEGISNYEFPSDMARIINGTFFDTSNRWPLPGPMTPTQWQLLNYGVTGSPPFERYRVMGNQLFLYPSPPTGITLHYEYITNAFLKSGDLYVSEWSADDNLILFDHRLVIYGVKLKWLSSIRQDTTQALVDYNRALEFAKSTEAPAPRLSMIHCNSYPMLSTANYPEGSWA